MPSYYVTHPNLGTSATIDAPSTEKARTTFLDYLERNHQINRRDRQSWRKNMVAEKLSDRNEVYSDVQLDYDYLPGGSTGPSLDSYQESYGGDSVERFERSEDPWVEPEEVREVEQVEPIRDTSSGLSPIERASLGR